MVLSARFCRQCGNLLDASEMTTRSLDAPAEPPLYDHGTRPANAAITAPTYPPAMMPPPPPPVIHGAPPANNKTVLFVILGVVVAMLIGMGLMAFLLFSRLSGPPAPPPPEAAAIEKGPPGSAPRPPRPPEPLRPPTPPTPGNVQVPFDAALLYPGATPVMSVNSTKGKVVQLTTPDSFNKVAEWYVKKINPTEDTNLPGSRILKGNGITVILTGGGDGTHIMLTDEKD